MSKLVNKIICITSLGEVNVECKQAGYMFTVVNGFLKSNINRVQVVHWHASTIRDPQWNGLVSDERIRILNWVS